jgi:proline racemase
MYGCFVVPPDDGGADLGVVFFHNAGYSTACGHGTIALATWSLEAGLVASREPETELTIDVPSGRVPVVASVEAGRVTGARFRNVPAWVEAERLEAAGLSVDVAYGGAFYACVEAPIPVEPAGLPRLIELGREVKRELEGQREFSVPGSPDIRDVYGVIFWQDDGKSDGALVQRNVTVFADGEVDRSPCGSGTSARLALLHARGELGPSRELLHRSIVDTEFRAKVVEEVQAQGRPAVVTEIAGSAYLTGYHEFVLEPDDEVGTGFLLR